MDTDGKTLTSDHSRKCASFVTGQGKDSDYRLQSRDDIAVWPLIPPTGSAP